MLPLDVAARQRAEEAQEADRTWESFLYESSV